jgi:hypothetical protein
MNYYLAQINIARFKAPLEDVSMKEFVDFLEPVNKLAEESNGFVWRLKDDSGQAASYIPSPFEDDEMLAINMSVWKDMESFKNFVYGTVHSYFLKSKTKWFEPVDRPHFVMWWVREGEIPTIEQGKGKLNYCEKHGATEHAFTFRRLFDMNGNSIT